MRRTAATAYSAAAPVKKPKGYAALAGHLVQRAVRFVDLPRARNHAAILVGIGVAEHDLLPMIPACEQRFVGLACPELAHDCGCILEVFDGFEERNGLQAGVLRDASDGVSAQSRKPQNVEDVFGAGGSADDVLADRLGAVGALEFADG